MASPDLFTSPDLQPPPAIPNSTSAPALPHPSSTSTTTTTTTTTTPLPTTTTYPEITPHGSLLIAYQVRNKPILLIGGGAVAATRLVHLLSADAHITLLCPSHTLHPEVLHRIATHPPPQITHIDRLYDPTLDLLPADAHKYTMVLAAIDDPAASTEIYTRCHAQRIPCNIADVPPECDFYFGSVHRDGPLQVMVSTNGNGPKLANLIRLKIAASLPRDIGAAIGKVGVLRGRLRGVAPGKEVGAMRMAWMTRVCERWSLAELAAMDEGLVQGLLGNWEVWRREGGEEGGVVVPGYRELMGLGSESEDEEDEDEEEEEEDTIASS
ncbi:putative NAD(P)-binding-domain-containing protein [Peziza echinospora]|nr:putative NAD(P)-binding-domain-containing protein [Peziza echinospora]